jgi:hypothetical protein
MMSANLISAGQKMIGLVWRISSSFTRGLLRYTLDDALDPSFPNVNMADRALTLFPYLKWRD